MPICSEQAWNNFVMHGDWTAFEPGSDKRSATVANLFIAAANNGGLNSFLTVSYDLSASEVLEALIGIGAGKAAQQLQSVLDGLGTELPVSTQEERWTRLDQSWHDDLDRHDVLSEEADEELMTALERHVAANEQFYFELG